ncbi:hypothetical protein [Microcoleus sp.]
MKGRSNEANLSIARDDISSVDATRRNRRLTQIDADAFQEERSN